MILLEHPTRSIGKYLGRPRPSYHTIIEITKNHSSDTSGGGDDPKKKKDESKENSKDGGATGGLVGPFESSYTMWESSFHKNFDDTDTYFQSLFALEYIGQHQHSVLGEGIREIPA